MLPAEIAGQVSGPVGAEALGRDGADGGGGEIAVEDIEGQSERTGLGGEGEGSVPPYLGGYDERKGGVGLPGENLGPPCGGELVSVPEAGKVKGA